MNRLLRFAEWIDRLTEQLGKLADWLVIFTVAVGFYNVIARYIGRFLGLKLSSNALIELQWYLFSVMFLLGFAYILKHGANVRVDFLYSHWSDRRKALVDLLGTVFFLIPFCILGLVVTWNPVLLSWGRLPDGSWGQWEMSADADGLPRAPIKTMILISFGLLLLQAIAQAIKYFAILKGYRGVAQSLAADTEQVPFE
ncbi:MAG: TRAP transporter small permease subunit [Elainella sp. Prado103]|jgi:TRAP-type mannitol/chloroaromatic compound transport system permease small subunit|nr:TRAP transporter small permease subunit [Elainella sp. Prado103]